MIIVDTNVWSETLRDSPDPNVLLWMRVHHAELHMPATARHELRVGVLQMPTGHRREELSRAIDRMLDAVTVRTVAYDGAAADAHAEIRARAQQAGRALSSEDGQILGIATARGASVATRNVRDFIDHGVPIVNPWEWSREA